MQFTNSIAQEILALKQGGGGGSGLDGPHYVPLAGTFEENYADLTVTGGLTYYIVTPAIPYGGPEPHRDGIFLGSVDLTVVSEPTESLDDPTMQYVWDTLEVESADTFSEFDPPFYSNVYGQLPATCSVDLAGFVVPNPAHIRFVARHQGNALIRLSVEVTNEWFLGSNETGTTTTVSSSGFFFTHISIP